MNKILFKLIEGKGKFFLGINWPEFPNLDDRIGKWYKETGGYLDPSEWYEREIKLCIPEALKNGEIVNPEVVKEELWKNDQRITNPAWSLYNWEHKMLKDGDTFDMPDGVGFEEISRHDHKTIDDRSDRPLFQSMIRLLPEKPVQKEESQTELWEGVLNYCEQHMINDIRLREYLEKNYTIKRKES